MLLNFSTYTRHAYWNCINYFIPIQHHVGILFVLSFLQRVIKVSSFLVLSIPASKANFWKNNTSLKYILRRAQSLFSKFMPAFHYHTPLKSKLCYFICLFILMFNFIQSQRPFSRSVCLLGLTEGKIYFYVQELKTY